MGYTRSINRVYVFQFDRLCTEAIEQTETRAKDDGRHVNIDFIHQFRLERLLQDARRAYHDILISGSLPGLANGAFNIIGDKDEWRSVLNPFLWDIMGNNKSRCPGWMTAPGMGDIKSSPPPDSGTIIFERLFQEFGTLL